MTLRYEAKLKSLGLKQIRRKGNIVIVRIPRKKRRKPVRRRLGWKTL